MYTSIYTNSAPALLNKLANTPELQRLADIGMHCGCDYADFPVYRRQRFRYTRLAHSVGVANIIWHFTGDIKQAVAGLFHDIATPVFAHAIDFLNNDYILQESTENETRAFIQNSEAIAALLNRSGIAAEEVSDYHRYPVADNETPMLSADRLEYTLGNGYIVQLMDLCDIKDIYDDLTVAKNENGADELCFSSIEKAKNFVGISLRNSYWFVSDEDRFSMQYVADTVRYALDNRILTPGDLLTGESGVIRKLKGSAKTSELWDKYSGISAVAVSEKKISDVYCVNVSAKKRYINPLVLTENGARRISEADSVMRRKLEAFLALSFDKWLYAKPTKPLTQE